LELEVHVDRGPELSPISCTTLNGCRIPLLHRVDDPQLVSILCGIAFVLFCALLEVLVHQVLLEAVQVALVDAQVAPRGRRLALITRGARVRVIRSRYFQCVALYLVAQVAQETFQTPDRLGYFFSLPLICTIRHYFLL